MARENTPGTAPAKVVHQVPGRIRVRFEPGVNVSEAVARLQETLSQYHGVLSVEPRLKSRSVVVHYSAAELELQRLIEDGFSAAAIDVAEHSLEAIATVASGTAVGRGVVKAVGRANARVEQTTGGVLDLRDAFPLTLFGLGIARVLQGNLQPVPWYNLLYYGYSTFSALHGRRGSAPPVPEPDAEEVARRRFAQGQITRQELRDILAELRMGAVSADGGEAVAPEGSPEAAPSKAPTAEAAPTEGKPAPKPPRRRRAQ
jgi:Heavy metal associated domain 2